MNDMMNANEPKRKKKEIVAAAAAAASVEVCATCDVAAAVLRLLL